MELCINNSMQKGEGVSGNQDFCFTKFIMKVFKCDQSKVWKIFSSFSELLVGI